MAPDMLATPEARANYRQLTLDTALGPGWEQSLEQYGECARFHLHDFQKVIDAVKDDYQSPLARIKESVVNWLDG